MVRCVVPRKSEATYCLGHVPSIQASVRFRYYCIWRKLSEVLAKEAVAKEAAAEAFGSSL